MFNYRITITRKFDSPIIATTKKDDLINCKSKQPFKKSNLLFQKNENYKFTFNQSIVV